jgi:protein TonB
MPVVAARYTASFLLALVVVFGLFWIMQYLIATADRSLDESRVAYMLDFVRVKPDEVIERKKPKPEKPPQPDEPPPEPPPPSLDQITPQAQTLGVSAAPVNPNIALDKGGFGLAPSDGEYLPIVKVQPIYPRRALSRGVEGFVIVEFTVTRLGTTRDIRVVDAQPPGYFESAAIQAAEKFKYKPRVVDGEAIEVPGVRNKITFEIEQ